MFLRDTVKATIGRDVELDVWARRAIYEKLTNDIVKYYRGYGEEHEDLIAKVSEAHQELHHGLLYLHREGTVILLQVVSRRVIDLIRSGSNDELTAETSRKIRDMITSAGAACTKSAVVYFPFDSNNEADIHVTADGDDPEQVSATRHYVNAITVATITRSSARDMQRMPGPSDLANPCDLCVARRLAQSCGVQMAQAPDHFSLKAWFGTAMHEKLERDLPAVYPHAQQEITVPVSIIQGLGQVKGHVDIYLPKKRSMGDWKSTDMKKLDKIRTYGVSASHLGQTMLYMYGLRKSGLKCDYATLTYIPRDSQNVSDIWVVSCAYREDVAVGLLNRTNSLMRRLTEGDVGSFQIDPDCYVCNVQPLIRR